MAVAAFLAGAAQGDAVQHGNAVLDDGGLADHHAGAVVDEDALADHRARVDVEGEQRARAALQEMRERPPPLQPQPVGGTVGLQRVIALEPEQRVEMGSAGRVTVGDRHDVGACRQTDTRIGREGFVEGLAYQGGRHFGRANEARKVIAQRALETRLAQDRGMERSREHGLGRGGCLGGLANPVPDRVHRAQICGPGLRRVLEYGAIHGALLRSASVPCDARGALDTPPLGKDYAARAPFAIGRLRTYWAARASSSRTSGSTLPPLFWM